MLAAREHGRYELKQKLLLRGYGESSVDQALDRLEQDGLLNEARFVEQFIYSRQKRGYGPVRIRNELRQKRVDRELVEQMLDDHDACWHDILEREHDRKYGADRTVDYPEMSRRARFLQYRGFPAELVRQLFEKSDTSGC